MTKKRLRNKVNELEQSNSMNVILLKLLHQHIPEDFKTKMEPMGMNNEDTQFFNFMVDIRDYFIHLEKNK